MTESELETFRLKMQIEVLRVLLRGIYTGLANSSPTAGHAFRNSFAKLREEHDKLVIPNLPEGYSDMLADEYQSALEDLISFIESGFKN